MTTDDVDERLFSQRNGLIRFSLISFNLAALLVLPWMQGCHFVDVASAPKGFDLKTNVLDTFPELPPSNGDLGGYQIHRLSLGVDAGQPGFADRVRVYAPFPAPQRSTPCVFVAPAGGSSFTGKSLDSEPDRACVSLAMAGFIVVEYEIEGDIGKNDVTQLSLTQLDELASELNQQIRDRT